jgi:two-component system, sensor histidine kinase PdtaS
MLKKVFFLCIIQGLSSLLLLPKDLVAQVKIDILEKSLQDSKSDSTTARILGELAWEIKFTNPKKSLEYATKELGLANKNNLVLYKADAYRCIGLINVVNKNYKQGVIAYDSCIFYANECKSEYYLASCLSLKAGMSAVFGDYDKAIELYELGLLHAKKANNPKVLAILYNNLSTAYKQSRKSPEKVKELLLQSIKNLESVNDHKNTAAAYVNLAQEYADEKNKSQASKYLKLSKKYLLKDTSDIQLIGVIYSSFATVYLAIDMIDSAKKYGLESEKILNALNVPDNLNDTYEALTKIYIANNNDSLAKQYALLTLELGKKQSRKITISNAFKYLSTIEENNGNPEKALEYYKLHKAWADSVFNTQREEYLQQMELKTAIAQQEFETKLETNKKLQENKYLTSKNKKLVILTIAFLLASIGLGLMSFSVLKSRKKILQINLQLQEEKKLVMQQSNNIQLLINEIHHRVKNNLTMLKSLLFLQSRSTINSEAKLILEEAQVRINSMALVHKSLFDDHENNKLNLPLFYENLLQELLHSYKLHSNEIDIQVEGNCEDINIEYAIPLAIIINELATNSLKYAFGNSTAPCIKLQIEQFNKQLIIEYKDNGVGLQDGIHLGSGGFGFKVISILTKQIKANIDFNRKENWSVFTISIPLQ